VSEKIKVAIIGCGAIANSAHIPAYMKNEKAEIKYFCDIIPERADAAVEKYGCGKAVYDYHEILDDPELDSVSVCTHNDLHSVIAIDFMRAGKDVLGEKPAARVLSEALEMQRVSHETDRILSIGVCNRFGNAVNHIKELIDAGELGEVYHVYASFRANRSIPGIGGDFPRGHQVDYVLGHWNDEERKAMPERLKYFGDAILSFAAIGPERTMNLFNKK